MPKLPPNFSIQKTHQTQLALSKHIILEDRLPDPLRVVGGVDVSYVDDIGIGAAVVLDYSSLEVLETSVAVCNVKMPYVPTLLSFRELPPAISAIKKLKVQPDVFLVDAHGWAHPYRCGFASHLGLALGNPTVGAAKSSLIGEPTKQNGRKVLLDKGDVIGEVVTIEVGCKPTYVSVGHMVSLETAVKIIRHCSKGKIAKPLLCAHNLATKTRLELEGKVK